MRIALFALGLSVQALVAQAPQPPVVSRSVVAEITGDTVLLGVLPPHLQGKVPLPSTSRVIGAVGRTALIASTLSPTAALKELEREMPRLGWALQLHSRPDWGFVFPEESENLSGGMYCGNGIWLIVMVVPSPAPGTRLRLIADQRGGSCDGMVGMTQGGWRAPATFDPIPLRLLNPVGARTHAYDDCPYAENPNVAQALMQTAMSADSLMSHYSKQLAESGWTPAVASSVVRTWTRSDSAGRPVRVELRITGRADQPRCYELSYEIRPVKP